MRSVFLACLAGLFAMGTTAVAEDCLMPNSNPFAQTNSTYGWFFDYEDSIVFSQSLRYTNVPPYDAQWKRLEVMEERDSVTLHRWNPNPSGGWIPEYVTIQDPVLVVTWASPLLASDGYESVLSDLNGLKDPVTDHSIMLGFVTKSNQMNATGQNQNCTLWFSKHGQTGEFLDDLFHAQNFDMNRSCFNLSNMKSYSENLEACQQSLLWGVPSAGVPYGFGWTSQPYQGNALPWWNTNIYIGVVDRRAMIRPSYNPTLIPQDEAQDYIQTYDGLPQWDNQSQSYAVPLGNVFGEGSYSDFTRGAWQAICPDYDCTSEYSFLAWDGTRIPFGSFGGVREAFRAQGESLEQLLEDGYMDENGQPLVFDFDLPIEVFNNWLSAYQYDNWVSDVPPWSSGAGFPFASIGLTVNWIQTSVNDSFGVSEFILKGKAPITWIAKRTASQYLGTREPGQVSWCDSCLGDLDMNGAVDVGDLLLLLQAWSQPQPCMTFDDTSWTVYNQTLAPPGSPFPYEAPLPMEDIGVNQILKLIDHWGPCTGWPPELASLRPPDCQ